MVHFKRLNLQKERNISPIRAREYFGSGKLSRDVCGRQSDRSEHAIQEL